MYLYTYPYVCVDYFPMDSCIPTLHICTVLPRKRGESCMNIMDTNLWSENCYSTYFKHILSIQKFIDTFFI